MDKNEVNIAFEILLEDIEEVFNMISNEGEKSLRNTQEEEDYTNGFYSRYLLTALG
jgi:hypothetical protein